MPMHNNQSNHCYCADFRSTNTVVGAHVQEMKCPSLNQQRICQIPTFVRVTRKSGSKQEVSELESESTCRESSNDQSEIDSSQHSTIKNSYKFWNRCKRMSLYVLRFPLLPPHPTPPSPSKSSSPLTPHAVCFIRSHSKNAKWEKLGRLYKPK